MLTHLELVGFKSFADKTRLLFAPGVTAVVGPNGSGKSNVVDAVRWVLGEQSAKTLRGGEMADVIFNGSAGRRGLGLAEVTVGFDNAKRLLAVDADEVRVTRRVYRDGTGEYLLNGQPARLKDVRDVFLGSGAGAGGYTVIAQGRVDELLAASARDRREIFDEAAGISRFKAKKAEALRKLLATEANLARSRDRLDSLDAQLRTLKLQAAKAQKYQEYSGRLKDLRVGLAAREYRELTAALEAETAALAELKADAGGAADRADELERATREWDAEVGRLEQAVRHEEAGLADARQRIAGFEATARHERATAAGYEGELTRLGRLRATLGYRVTELEAEAAEAAAEAVASDDRLRAAQQAAATAEADLAAASERVAVLDQQTQAGQDQQFDLVRRAAAARSRATADLAQVERLQKEYTRKLGEADQAAARRAALATGLDGLSRADADLRARLGDARGRLAELQAARDELTADAERVGKELEDLRVRQGATIGRVEVLEGLERSLDGVGAGVRAILGMMNDERGAMNEGRGGDGETPEFIAHRSSLIAISGLVADLLTVPREVAEAVELALGDAAQRFVVADPAAVDALAAAAATLPGRVGFIPVRASGGREPPDTGGTGLPAGVPLSRGSRPPLARQVRCDHPGLAGLPDQLLGDVYLVDTLADARRLAVGLPGCRFVTPAGELLEPDGTLTAGPARSGAGLVSRKSELRDLRGRLAALAGAVAAAEA
ncbi:MAG: AAA family ATPase, partial [Gemmataceae bacterium]|nr:AAA family ATPase [Gemmataceae bacterium]